MHLLQQKLLKLVDKQNIGTLTLREIGELVGDDSPQKIKHHLGQLEKKGFIKIDRENDKIEKAGVFNTGSSQLLAVPILGTADCGPATFYAEDNHEGYLKLSKKFLGKNKGVYAIRASGGSMNRAMVSGKTIEDGDYVLVDSEYDEPQDNDVVVSVIEGVANIKKFRWDPDLGRVALVSVSTHHYPPIFLHEDDDFQVVGKVVQVIKKID